MFFLLFGDMLDAVLHNQLVGVVVVVFHVIPVWYYWDGYRFLFFFS